MPLLTISEVARRAGCGVQRFATTNKLASYLPLTGLAAKEDTTRPRYRLLTLQRARQIGFTLDEIRQLFFGLRNGTPPSERWKKLSQRKLAELEQLIKAIQLVLQGQGKCGCASLEECGKGLLRNGCGKVT